jgi:galactokinase/mevalonate kinase-like predicted kinase
MTVTSQTPYRLPIAGGLSDVEPYARLFGGRTLSVTLDRHVRVTVQAADGAVSSLTVDGHRTTFAAFEDAPVPVVAGVLKRYAPSEPLAIEVTNDLPPEGGLAASGALTVGLVHALALRQGERPNAAELARRSAHIEVHDLNGVSGYHDSAICAHGGLKQFSYDEAGAHLGAWQANDAAWQTLERTVRIFDTGRPAPSGPSLRALAATLQAVSPPLERMKAAVQTAADALNNGDADGLAHAVRLQQTEKMMLPGDFTSPDVERLVAAFAARKLAVQIPGGKIGRFLFVCDPSGQHDGYHDLLPDAQPVTVGFSGRGSHEVAT